jgi:hypothetical protein
MRDYAKVAPQFWIGQTGKTLRKAGAEAQVVAMYLLTSPHANMLGLYYLPTVYLIHETGLGDEGALKGLQRAIEAGFCSYDEASEVVWVHEMARYQIADQLKDGDNRCKGVQSEYDSLPSNPYLAPFFDRYASAFHMANRRGNGSPSQAPSKPLGSQEQEQEQEQEKENTLSAGADSPAQEGEGEKGDQRQRTIPAKEILAAYHEHLPMMPAVRVMTEARKRKLKARWTEDASRQSVDYWRRFFAYVAASDFLTGRDSRWTGCDFEWLIEAGNHVKVIEGKYENREAQA